MSGQHKEDTNHSGHDLAHQLRVRLEQQAAIASLGRQALAGMDLQELMDEGIRCAAETLDIEFGKILELVDGRLILRAGTGWRSTPLGSEIIPAEADLQAGHTVLTGEPVIVENFATDTHYRRAPLLSEHDIVSSLSVPIQQSNRFWGVMAVHADHHRRFSEHDVNFVQAVANVIGDAVERKANEDVQSQLAAIVEGSHDAIFRKSLDGTVTSWNAAAEKMYGYTADEIVGRSVDVLYPPELRHTLTELMEEIGSGKSISQLETVRVRKDGSRIPISLSVSPIKDQGGRVVGASTIAQDITERKLAEDALKRAHDDLERRVAERTRELRDAVKELESFSYAVSHDLRAPLRSIDGFARALLEDFGEELGETAHNYLSRIMRGSQRMSVLIDDLLNLSRLNRAPLSVETVDLSDLGQQAVAELQEREPERKLRFDAPDSLPVPGDRHLLRIALVNLLDNAWKFTSSREESFIRLGVEEQDGESVYFVEDNGIGFDMRYADKLFVPFQRLHSSEVEGTGIGLATVQRIIHRHGGRLWAMSEVGKGTTFYFTLGSGTGAEAGMSAHSAAAS